MRGDELAVHRDVAPSPYDRAREAYLQGLWFTLARSTWNSLVIVPADESSSGVGLATSLADIGRRLRGSPVTFLVMAGAVDYASAGRFVSAVVGGSVTAGDDPASARVIVAVPPVVSDPLALAVIDAADAVALCVRVGRTRREAAQRTIDLVRRERILGCVFA